MSVAIPIEADIDVLPPAVNFGTVAIGGAATTRAVLIENAGNSVLVVHAIGFQSMSPELSASGVPTAPFDLDPGASVSVTLTYAPVDAGLDSAMLSIGSSDPDEASVIVPIQGIGGVPTTCSIVSAPSRLDFGLVERGRTLPMTVQLRNHGALPCAVTNLGLAGASALVITSSGAGGSLAPRARQAIGVTYAPTSYGVHNAMLTFNTTDPAQPLVSLPVTGSSAPLDLRIQPLGLDFGVVPVTCRSVSRAFTLYNQSSAAVSITDLALDASTSTELELQPFGTPATIQVGGSAVASVRYHPTDVGPDSGVLYVAADISGQNRRFTVPLAGDGQINPTIDDTFHQGRSPQTDILFIVDNSTSMPEEQSTLASTAGPLIAALTSSGIDYRIGVTTTDLDATGAQGRLVEMPPQSVRIVRPGTPTPAAALAANVAVGTSGLGVERGLEAAFVALSDPLINGHNAGFLRPAADLQIIVVSDGDDASSRSPSFYENYLRTIERAKPAGRVTFNAVVGARLPSCSGPGGGADYAARYIQVAVGTGGLVESICNASWGQALTAGLGVHRSFPLSSTPVPSTISIEVDGVAVPSLTAGGQQRWSYDQPRNSVDFSTGSVPQAGSITVIRYAVACLP